MKLSAPIHVLKSQAKSLKRIEKIKMTDALDIIAKREGYSSWSLLNSKSCEIYPTSYDEILDFFNPGDLIIVGARPSYGKTTFTIGLFVKAIQEMKAKSYYFTLSETHKDVAGRIALYDEMIGQNVNRFEINYFNNICADYIIENTQSNIGERSIIVVDYLQLLDEKRINEPLENQIKKLKLYAKEKKCTFIFIAQVSRELEYKNDRRPTKEDIRLPNPLDLSLINKFLFLYCEGSTSNEVEVSIAAKSIHNFKVSWDRLKSSRFY